MAPLRTFLLSLLVIVMVGSILRGEGIASLLHLTHRPADRPTDQGSLFPAPRGKALDYKQKFHPLDVKKWGSLPSGGGGGDGGPRHVKTATLSTNTLLGGELDLEGGRERDGKENQLRQAEDLRSWAEW